MDPLVSIIIPVFNSENWIDSTIRSALSQTWKNKEIIIIDDGSTDNSFEIIKHYENSNVKIIKQENKGASAARNLGLDYAQGDYIQWLDSDDILAPDKISTQLENCEFKFDPKTLLSSAWGYFYHRLKSVKLNQTPLWKDLYPIDWIKLHINSQYFMADCSWLVSRELTTLAGKWNEDLSYNDDGEYFCRVISKCESIKFEEDALSYYRKGNLESLSRSISVSQKAFQSLSLSVNLCVDILLSMDNSDESKKISINALNKLIINDDSFKAIVQSNKERIVSLGGKIELPKVSKKFKFINQILGEKLAQTLKTKLWYFQISLSRSYEKCLSIVFNDRI